MKDEYNDRIERSEFLEKEIYKFNKRQSKDQIIRARRNSALEMYQTDLEVPLAGIELPKIDTNRQKALSKRNSTITIPSSIKNSNQRSPPTSAIFKLTTISYGKDKVQPTPNFRLKEL